MENFGIGGPLPLHGCRHQRLRGGVQLAVEGRSTPAKLSVDVTKKPLIALAWYGLYVVLAGGLISTVARFRQALKLDAAPALAGGVRSRLGWGGE